MRKKKMFERLVEIRDLQESLESEKEELRNKLLLIMDTKEKIYGDNDVLEKKRKESVVLHPKEKLFEILGEAKYVELSSIGISNIRGQVSDKKLNKLIKKTVTDTVLVLRRLV